MNKVFKDEAIPFITYDEGTRSKLVLLEFQINEDAIAMISTLDKPLGVLSVAGMYRTGKSYLLNKMLLNSDHGFGVGPTVNPCTKGLWIWGRPISGTSADGEPIQILIIDTEGFGALDEDSNHDMKIFTLSLYFLYNSMGSIDEAAIQSMNMVISLTKHIRLRNGAGETDTEEYASFLPQFLWVVRDFALQLVDEDGETINSREYLDKALGEQSGFSDRIEEKNRIRRLIKSFFKDRDCVTMVRPLTNEEELQELDTLDMDQLRPEFVEQVMDVRRKVLNRMKVKKLHGNSISGKVLVELAQSYVEAINTGAVPNIENAWSNICRDQSMKAMNTVLEELTNYVQDNIMPAMPMEESEIKEFKTEAKNTCLSRFEELTEGFPVDITNEYRESTMERLKAEFRMLLMENEKQCINHCEGFLCNGYSQIENKIKSGGFQGKFNDYVDELRAFQHYFMENGPPGPDRRQIMLEFSFGVIDEAAVYFMRASEQDLEVAKNTSTAQVKYLEGVVEQVKEESEREKERLEIQVRQLRQGENQFMAKEEELNQMVESMNQEKYQVLEDSKKKCEEVKNESITMVEEYKQRLGKNEETMKESFRKTMMKESEFEKERALMQQKIDFLESRLNEFEGKGKQNQDDIKTQKKQYQSEVKEVAQRYDQQIKTLTRQLNDWQEKAVDLEGQLVTMEQTYEMDKQKWEDQRYQSNNGLSQRESQMQGMNQKIEKMTQQYQEQLSNIHDEMEDLKEDTQTEINDLKSSLKDKENEQTTDKNRYDKEIAIYKQKMEFITLQLNETRIALDDSKKQSASMAQIMEEKSEGFIPTDQHDNIIQSLRDNNNKEIRDKDNQLLSQKKQFELINEEIEQEKEDVKLKYNMLSSSVEKESLELNNKIDALTQQLSQISQKNKILEQQLQDEQGENSNKTQEQLYELEQELEQRTNKADQDMKDVQDHSEEQLLQLKQFYEQEKDRMEKRMLDNKIKHDKQNEQIQEEYEERISQQQQQYEEDIEYQQEEFREMENRLYNYQQTMESEQALQSQKIEQLESVLKDNEERYGEQHNQQLAQLKSQLDKIQTDKDEMYEKIGCQTQQINNKERELTTLKAKLKSIDEDLNRKINDNNSVKQDITNEKIKLQEEMETLREDQNNIQNTSMQERLQYERDLALQKQKIDFQENRMEEILTEKNNIQAIYEQKIQTLKEEQSQFNEEAVQKLNEGSIEWQGKYEEKRKQLKDMESGFKKQLNGLEREKAVQEEKLTNLVKRLEEGEEGQKDELSKTLEQVKILNETIKTERDARFEERDSSRASNYELEKNLQDVTNSYDRDKLLWDEKSVFLEEQKNQYKTDLIEVQKKLDATLEKMQRNQDKMNNAENHQSLINTIEGKFKTQLKEQNDTHQKMYNELMEKNKIIEKEGRQLRDRIQLQQRDGQQDRGILEKKMGEFQDNEKRLTDEINEMKSEREKKNQESQKGLQKEKDLFKTKLSEMETKCKEAEQKRSALVFEFEKEKTRWAMEREQIVETKNEIQDQLKMAENKREHLLRDNEKLKNENRGRGRASLGRSGIMTGISNMGNTSTGSVNNTSTGVGNFAGGVMEAKPGNKFTSFAAWKKEKDVSNGPINKENLGLNLPMKIEGKGPVKMMPLPKAPILANVVQQVIKKEEEENPLDEDNEQ